MKLVRPKLPPAFTLIELLIVTAIIGLLISILVPAVISGWRAAQRVKCASHLRDITIACKAYAADHAGRWPNAFTAQSTRTDALGNAPGEPGGLRGPNLDDGTLGTDNKDEVVNSNSASLWLLVAGEYLPPETLICPCTADAPDLIRNPKDVRDFLSRRQCSYSFQCRLGNRRIPDTWKLAVAADRSPFFDPCNSTEDPEANSFNHFGQGQNVAFVDGRVQWLARPFYDATGDWFYRAWKAPDDPTPDGIPSPEATPLNDLDALLK